MNGQFILSAGDVSWRAGGILQAWNLSQSGLGGALWLVALMIPVVLGVFVWAAFFRKTGRRHAHQHKHHWVADKPDADGSESRKHQRSSGFSLFGRRHRRHKRRRGANPTLAETGGLPPARDPESEPPPVL